MSQIPYGITFEEFRRRIEDKNTLTQKGALYVGTGNSESYTRPDGEIGTIYETDALNPPTEANQVLISDTSAEGKGLKYQNIVEAVNEATTDSLKVNNAVNAEYSKSVALTDNDPSRNSNVSFTIGEGTGAKTYQKTIKTGAVNTATWASYSRGLKTEQGGTVIVNGVANTDGSRRLSPNGTVDIGNSNYKFRDAYFSGEVTSGTFYATSDKRLKENIKSFKNEKSILDLPIYKFNFKSDKDKKTHIGCIAQDLREICPEIVHEDEDGYLSIEESKLVYLLLNEVKKIQKEIEVLEAK